MKVLKNEELRNTVIIKKDYGEKECTCVWVECDIYTKLSCNNCPVLGKSRTK